MSRAKVAVIGAGNVGATTAQRIAEAGIADVILTDIVEGMPQGKSLDIYEAAPVVGSPARLRGTNDLADIAGSDVVVSNPLDIMTQLVLRRTGFEPRRVMGMAGVLDAARFACFIAMELDIAPTDVRAMVLGGHGDAMVPLPRLSSVSGIPITEMISAERIAALVDRAAKGGGEIVNLLKTGSAFYAPSASATIMVASILRDEKRILPAAAYLCGQYGIKGVYCGVPVKIGAEGVDKIVELNLTAAELAALKASAEVVREGVKVLGIE
jgi:malate dehydrogenase